MMMSLEKKKTQIHLYIHIFMHILEGICQTGLNKVFVTSSYVILVNDES